MSIDAHQCDECGVLSPVEDFQEVSDEYLMELHDLSDASELDGTYTTYTCPNCNALVVIL